MTAFANTTQKNLLRLAIWTTGADFLGRAIGNIGAFEQMSYPRSLPSFFYFCGLLNFREMTGNELIQQYKGQKIAVVFTGIPASGKSTFYKRYFEPADFQHINLDTLRTRQRETAFMEECVSLNCNVVIDNTNTTAEERKKYIDLFKTNDYRIVGMYFQSILKDCIARNKLRENPVPCVAIPYMQNRLVIPSYAEGFDELYFVKFDGNGDFVIENWIE